MPRSIQHIVMWRVRGDTLQERTAACEMVKAAFHGLKGLIPGICQLEVGINISTEDYACDVVLVSTFSDLAALNAYAEHPAHLRVKQELRDLRIARFMVDYASDLPDESDGLSATS